MQTHCARHHSEQHAKRSRGRNAHVQRIDLSMGTSKATTIDLVGMQFAGRSRGTPPCARWLQSDGAKGPESVCEQIYKVSKLPGVQPRRQAMVASALFHLALSITHLARAVTTIALFSTVLSVILVRGLL